MVLLHEQHFIGLGIAFAFQTIQVQTGAYFHAVIVQPIPVQSVISAFQISLLQGFNQLSLHVIDAETHLAGFGQRKGDGGIGIKRIGVIAQLADGGWRGGIIDCHIVVRRSVVNLIARPGARALAVAG